VGSGDPEQEQLLQDYIRANSLDKNVIFRGFQSEVSPFLEKADLFVSSSFTEGHPIAVLEAMASKKLCLVSDIGPHRLFTSESVLFFGLESPDVLADLIQQIDNNRSHYRKLAKSGYDEVAHKYSLDLMFENYSAHYS